jgi:hypothetical protein
MSSRIAKFKKSRKRAAPDDSDTHSVDASLAVAATAVSVSASADITTSNNINNDEQYTYDTYRHELETMQPPLAPEEAKMLQSLGNTQLSLKQLYAMQAQLLEVGLTPKLPIQWELQEATNKNVHGLFSTQFYASLPVVTLKKLDPRTFHTFFKLLNPVTFAFNDAQMEKLGPKHTTNYPFDESSLRRGMVYNMGGLPLTLEWCPLVIEDRRFLFVSIVDFNADVKEFTDAPCCLSILEYSSTGFKLNKQIYIDSTVKEMKFSFLTSERAALLTMVLSSGAIEIWKVTDDLLTDNSDGMYYKVQSGVRNWKLSNQVLKITSVSYVASNVLIIVTNHGHIGQYNIEANKLDYLLSLRLPSLLSVKTSIPVDVGEQYITACVSCTDFEQYLVRLPLPVTNKPLMNNVRLLPAIASNKDLIYDRSFIYLYNLKTFVLIEGNFGFKQCAIDAPLTGQRIKIQSDNIITCIANDITYKDGVLNNGFKVLTAHSNGSVRLCNILDMFTNTDRKNHTASIKLFQLHRSTLDKNCYWLDLTYQVDKSGELPAAEKVKRNKHITPDETCPTKVAILGDTIATAYAGGLLVIEELVV